MEPCEFLIQAAFLLLPVTVIFRYFYLEFLPTVPSYRNTLFNFILKYFMLTSCWSIDGCGREGVQRAMLVRTQGKWNKVITFIYLH